MREYPPDLQAIYKDSCPIESIKFFDKREDKKTLERLKKADQEKPFHLYGVITYYDGMSNPSFGWGSVGAFSTVKEAIKASKELEYPTRIVDRLNYKIKEHE
jgi:hypothetical protein